MDTLFFWLFSCGMIVSGLAVILNRNPVASALCFVLTILFMAALFFMLNAFFLGWIEILVTAGAVMVLFLFVIMLLDITAMEHVPRQKVWMGLALAIGLGFLYLVALTLNGLPWGSVSENSLPPQIKDDTHQIGHLLFSTYVAPFEITSLLILVATIGVIVLCKQDNPSRPSPGEEIDREAPSIAPPKETSPTR
jgi:NADH-quinone oxidoreductase subunit J